MPNVFGLLAQAGYSSSDSSSGVPGTPSVLIPLYDPRMERSARQRFRRDVITELARANSMYVPRGKYPARGWILVRRGDYDKLDHYATNFVLQMDDFIHPPRT